MSRVGRALALLLLLAGCRTIGAAPSTPITVHSLEVSFDAEGKGLVELGLEIRSAGGTATKAQWQLLLDGRPLGSGVQLLSQRLPQGSSTVLLSAPLPLAHATRDEGWRTVSLEVSGELTVTNALSERFPFAFRRQALMRRAPRP